MAQQGKADKVGTKEKNFAGTGIEGQKGADDSAEAPAFDTEGATCVVTHRDGLKRVWFRDGTEIGVEDAG